MFLAQPGEFGDIRLINTNTLAYIGDAVYELYIREHAMQIRMENVDMMSSLTVKYVKAESQALGIKAILDNLSEEEQSVVRRGRNRKIRSTPRAVDPVIYKTATGLEALIGYLYIKGEDERLTEVVLMIIDAIDRAS